MTIRENNALLRLSTFPLIKELSSIFAIIHVSIIYIYLFFHQNSLVKN